MAKTDDSNTEIIAPNVSIAMAPSGYIRVALGYDLLNASFYVDGTAARLLSEHFAAAADEFERIWSNVRAAEEGDDIIMLGDYMTPTTSEVDGEVEYSEEGVEIAVEHDTAVDDAVALAERPNDFD